MINFFLNHTPLFYLTQSLWRDEAFSVWIAQDSIPEVIRRTSGDFNPPLYYVILHYWMQIFGRSEVALRGLSVFFFCGFLCVVYIFAKKLFQSTYWAKVALLLGAINPLLMYYAFELRMYSLLTLLSTLSMYFLYTQNWLWYVIVGALGMYTQPYMAFIIMTQCIYLLLTKRFPQAIKNVFVIGLLYLPWIPTLIKQYSASGPMWIYPVNLTLVSAVLGNIYFGYEGTPGSLWRVMQIVSVLLLVPFLKLLLSKTTRKTSILFALWLFVPLILVIAISFIKPIYVLRYVIFTAVGEIFLIVLFLKSINNKNIRNALTVGTITLTLIINMGVVSFHRKVDIRSTFKSITSNLKSADVIYTQTPLIFYESIYYAPQNIPVYLYNPHHVIPPLYVGGVGMPMSVWKDTYPTLPKRAFLISETGTYTIVFTSL